MTRPKAETRSYTLISEKMDAEFKGGDISNWFHWLWKYDRNRIFREYLSESTRNVLMESVREELAMHRYDKKITMGAFGIDPAHSWDYFITYIAYEQMMWNTEQEQRKRKAKFENDYWKLYAELNPNHKK